MLYRLRDERRIYQMQMTKDIEMLEFELRLARQHKDRAIREYIAADNHVRALAVEINNMRHVNERLKSEENKPCDSCRL